jgi:Type I phosphodiesterase / nucleotide pyrophosphatase
LVYAWKKSQHRRADYTNTTTNMKFFFLSSFVLISICCSAQQHKTENLVIVTLDGMRWQEVFGGADLVIMKDKRFNHDSSAMEVMFGGQERTDRRQKLFPFLWGTISVKGQLYGDRLSGSEVNTANPYKFSYPGYNEIFTGYPDLGVKSNDKIKNPNTNVLEFIQKQKGYQGRIAAFTTWDVFPYILNTWRNGIYVNSDVDSLKFGSPSLQLINDMQFLEAKPLDERLDLLTYYAGREYLKAYKPRVLYIAFDETDDFAHLGLYDQYLKSAHAEDGMIRDLWNTLQSMPEYRDKTTLIVTCDHGRGDLIKEQWTDHGEKIVDAGQIWIAALGPDTKAEGLVKTKMPLYQKQIAPTLAAILGFQFVPDQGSADPIKSIYY